MAPEICNDDKYTNKVDIWALGCIIYELSTLNHCFNQPNLIEKIIGGNYEKITYSNNIFSDWQNIIDLLLKKNPNERPDIDNVIKLIKKFDDKEFMDEISLIILQKRKRKKQKLLIKNNTIKIKINKYSGKNRCGDNEEIYFISQNYLEQIETSKFQAFVNREDYGQKNYFKFREI